jgi:peroxiredoxin Q/BCP
MNDPLRTGAPAPDFELPGDDGHPIRLSKLKGRKIVLYFYPRDDTSGCTREAIDFNSLRREFASIGADIIGISADSVASHQKFKKKHGLDFPLLADERRSALEAYGVWVEKSMYGRKYMGIERTTVLIGADGLIRQVWPKVKVAGHAAEVLAAATNL